MGDTTEATGPLDNFEDEASKLGTEAKSWFSNIDWKSVVGSLGTFIGIAVAFFAMLLSGAADLLKEFSGGLFKMLIPSASVEETQKAAEVAKIADPAKRWNEELSLAESQIAPLMQRIHMTPTGDAIRDAKIMLNKVGGTNLDTSTNVIDAETATAFKDFYKKNKETADSAGLGPVMTDLDAHISGAQSQPTADKPAADKPAADKPAADNVSLDTILAKVGNELQKSQADLKAQLPMLNSLLATVGPNAVDKMGQEHVPPIKSLSELINSGFADLDLSKPENVLKGLQASLKFGAGYNEVDEVNGKPTPATFAAIQRYIKEHPEQTIIDTSKAEDMKTLQTYFGVNEDGTSRKSAQLDRAADAGKLAMGAITGGPTNDPVAPQYSGVQTQHEITLAG